MAFQQCCLQYQLLCSLCPPPIPHYNNNHPYPSISIVTNPPVISLPPINLTVSIDGPAKLNATEGQSLLLICRANGKFMDGHHTWRWTKNHRKIPKDLKQFFGYLRIPKVELKHSGTYKCEAERRGVKGSAQLNLTVVKEVLLTEVEVVPNKQAIKQGETAHFRCVAKGPFTNLQYYWTHGQLENLPQDIIVDNENITIKDVDISDVGEYVCTVVHKNTKLIGKGLLEVEEVTSTSTSTTTQSSSTTELTSEATSVTTTSAETTTVRTRDPNLQATIQMWFNGTLLAEPQKAIPPGMPVKLICLAKNRDDVEADWDMHNYKPRPENPKDKEPEDIKDVITIDSFNYASQGSYICAVTDGGHIVEADLDVLCSPPC